MIPRVYKRILKSDFTMNPSRISKKYRLSNYNLEEKGIVNNQGIYNFLLAPIGTPQAENDSKNSDGSFKSVIWHSIKHQYYSPYILKEHGLSHTYKYLSEYLNVLGIPYMLAGEMLKPGSVKIINSNFGYDLIDDGKGNLYKSNSSDLVRDFYNSNKLTCEYDLSLLYPTIRGYTLNSKSKDIFNGKYTYSRVGFESIHNDVSVVRDDYHNGNFIGMILNSDSYIRTPHNPKLNFIDGGFLIHFKLNVTNPSDQLSSLNFISVNDVKINKRKGLVIKEDNVSSRNVEMVYEEELNVATNVYPFKFSWVEISPDNWRLQFKRSDGLNSVTINGPSFTEDGDYDIQLYRFQINDVPKISLYINGSLIQTVTDTTKYTFNDYDLIIGNYNPVAIDPASEFIIGDIKFYNNIKYRTQQDVNNLAINLTQPENHYGGYIGNVFYRNGNIVFTPRLTTDFQYFDNFQYIEFESIYTIYEYESLCRIGKGDFNLTQNPTARIHHESDIFIPEIQAGSMKPYFTSVGLYNDKGELMVIGKMSQPVQVRDDVDINVLINWTT